MTGQGKRHNTSPGEKQKNPYSSINKNGCVHRQQNFLLTLALCFLLLRFRGMAALLELWHACLKLVDESDIKRFLYSLAHRTPSAFNTFLLPGCSRHIQAYFHLQVSFRVGSTRSLCTLIFRDRTTSSCRFEDFFWEKRAPTASSAEFLLLNLMNASQLASWVISRKSLVNHARSNLPFFFMTALILKVLPSEESLKNVTPCHTADMSENRQTSMARLWYCCKCNFYKQLQYT